MNNDNQTTPSEFNQETQTENTPLEQPVSEQVAKPPKGRKKLWISIIAVLVVGAGVGLYFYLNNTKDTSTPTPANTQKSNAIVLNNSNKPASKYNTSTEMLAVGNVTYKADKLTTLETTNTLATQLQQITPVPKEEGLSGVAFIESGEDTYTRRLVMYDFAAKKSYIVNEDKGDQKVRHYYHPVILSDHFVAWYTLTFKTPIDLEGSINIVDLNTGAKKVILQDTAGNLPETTCCSVSPNGLYLVVSLPPNKLDFYSAGGEKAQEITINASVLPLTEGQDNDGYAAAQRSGTYPALHWLDDNRVVLATGAPVRFTVDSDGTHIFKANNGLDILDLQSGKQTPLVTAGKYSITWFDIRDKMLVFASHASNETLDHGPITGMVNLYTLDTSTNAEPKMLEGIAHDKLGGVVLSKSGSTLYVQEDNSAPVTAVNLASGERKTIASNISFLIESTLTDDVLVGGNQNGLEPSTSLNIYTISTGKATKIY